MTHVTEAIVDTGALLALLDRDDGWHEPCVSAVNAFRLPLITTTAVLTELFHLVGDSKKETKYAWDLVRSGLLTVHSIGTDDLPELAELMKRYADRPMDFADATLVLAAQRNRVNTVFTVDFNDFETYRISGKKRFRIVPDRTVRHR